MAHADLIRHLEEHLGEINYGWKDSSNECSLIIVSFTEQPCISSLTFSTIGLSRYTLIAASGRMFREELIFSVYEMTSQTESIAKMLLYVAERLASSLKALVRGDVIEIGYPIVPDSKMTGLYATVPVYHKDELHVLKNNNDDIVFVLLVPICQEEIDFINTNGWSKFEDILEEKDPDLLDVNRDAVV